MKLSDFPVHYTVSVAWGDMDALGHVNNTVYFRWFESARIAFFLKTQLMVQESMSAILASQTCHYRRPVQFPDQITVGIGVSKIGNTSITLNCAMFSEAQQAIVADGQGIIVAYDYEKSTKVSLSEPIRQALTQFLMPDPFSSGLK